MKKNIKYNKEFNLYLKQNNFYKEMKKHIDKKVDKLILKKIIK